MKMIKLLVSDVDGTLLNGGSISLKDITAIQYAEKQGIQLCLASGRMYPELQEIDRQIDMKSHCVSQNGSFVHLNTGENILTKNFDLSMSLQLIRFTYEHQFPFTVSCIDNQIYCPTLESSHNLQERMMMPITECTDIEGIFKAGILPCKFSFFGDLAALALLQKDLNESFAPNVDTYIADKDCLDVMPQNVSKGLGIAALLRHLEIRPEEIVCVGDSFNDLPLFQTTPNSFSMQHSDHRVQKAAAGVVQSVAEVVDWVDTYNRAHVPPVGGR